jgi:hypothetical protein
MSPCSSLALAPLVVSCDAKASADLVDRFTGLAFESACHVKVDADVFVRKARL